MDAFLAFMVKAADTPYGLFRGYWFVQVVERQRNNFSKDYLYRVLLQ